jgi:acyl dehydratase
MPDTALPATVDAALIKAGESFSRSLRYSPAQIAEFARLSGDDNPLHHDADAARQANYSGVIASGQQTAAAMMGLVATQLSQPHGDVRREVLCLNFNFAFKSPIHAETEVDVRWLVSSVEYSARLGGWIGQLNGSAFSAGTDCVVARGTVLVKRRD